MEFLYNGAIFLVICVVLFAIVSGVRWYVQILTDGFSLLRQPGNAAYIVYRYVSNGTSKIAVMRNQNNPKYNASVDCDEVAEAARWVKDDAKTLASLTKRSLNHGLNFGSPSKHCITWDSAADRNSVQNPVLRSPLTEAEQAEFWRIFATA